LFSQIVSGSFLISRFKRHSAIIPAMKTPVILQTRHRLRLGLTIFALGIFVMQAAYAGLTLEMNVIRYDQYGYYFAPNLGTNSAAPSVPFGDYYITSPGYPTNGSSAFYHYDTNGFNQIGGGPYGYGDFDGMIQELTNSTWSISVTNSVTTNVYYFNVTPHIVSNDLPYVNILFPTNGAVNITNQPTYAWQGPTNYSSLVVYGYNFGNNLPVTQTSLPSPSVLYEGINSFTAHYDSNSTTAIVSSEPTNNSGPIFSWDSTAHLQDYVTSQFTVGIVDTSGTSHILVAHYAWDGTNGDGTASGTDSSGNGYDMNFGGGGGTQGGENSTTNAAAGPRAIQFRDGDGNSAGYVGWNPTPAALLTALSGSFSISCWIKTTQTSAGGWDQAPAYYGAGIISADNSGQANDVIPLALTGSKIGFNTGGDVEDVTLNSTMSVNDGNYHHVVVTRNQQTGQKIIYIDGVLDSFSSGTTNLLNDPQILTIGALSDANDPDASSAYYYQGYDGELDDVQIYSGVLSVSEVANLFASPGSTVANGGGGASGGHKNVAHYTFDTTNTNTFDLGLDSSPKGNNLSGYSYWGQVHTNSTDAKAGGGAVMFFGTSSINANNQVLSNLDAVLAGSFSFSTWVKTTASRGNDSDNAYFGAPIFWAYNDHNNTNDTIPLAITGGKAAFTTRGGNSGASDTLHSLTSVNDDNYHLIAVTRDQVTGEKKIYVDGNFEASQIGTTNPLNGNNYQITVGGTVYSSYTGLLDDLQIYSGVLSGNDVAYLYNHPGSNVVDTSGQDFNAALNNTNLTWTTSGDANWFVETAITHDGVAAQSGVLADNTKYSSLQTTVTGPGTLTFWWSSAADNSDFDLEFDIDGGFGIYNDYDDLHGNTDWTQDTFQIPTGVHTLTWFAYDADSTNDAGFLDQVSYVAAPTNTAPIITVNPFNQTNYPGYSVALYAAATSNPTATWQWFKVGSGLIAGATTNFYIPTNSGTAGVAGSYFAVATNIQGSANTTTAAVTFVSVPLPPDWSLALKSPFQSVDSSQFNKDYYLGCAVDSAGEVYVAAQYFGNMDVLTNGYVENVLTAVGTNGAAALVKHDANGKPIWGVGLTNNQPASYSYGVDVASAPGNGAYLESEVVGTNWLGTNIFANNGAGSILLSRFDPNGSNIWSRFISNTSGVFGLHNALVSDATGNVTIAGVMNSGTVDVGGTNVTASVFGGFMVQYDANGTVRWAQTFPDFPLNLAYNNGRIYVSLQSSSSSGVTSVSIGTLSNVTDRAWGVACLNATNGQALWLQGVGGPYGANFNGVGDDVPLISVSGSDVFLTGTAYGSSAVFGGLSVSWPGTRGQYFARYDTNGNPQVATSFGSTTTATWASAANASGVYICGDFDYYSRFSGDVIAAPVYAQNDLGPNYFSQPFLAKFDRNGNPLWARNGVSSDLANFRGLATTPGGVWACGFLKLSSFLTLAQFGTNSVYGDYYIVSAGIFGTIYPTQGGMIAKITDSSASALPVTILNPQASGGNFQFTFLSQSGFNHNILYRTNLVTGNWLTNSTVIGDGTLKTNSVPLSLFSPSKQGFIRVSTQ
jgi:hypothetical protein